MAYTQGVTAAMSSQGTVWRDIIEAAFNAHDNWDFVEEWTSGTQVHRIWRNRGSGLGANRIGTDFFVGLMRDTTALTTFRMYAFEMWDATAKRIIRPCGHAQAVSPPAANANGSYGNETTGFSPSDVATYLYSSVDTTTGNTYTWALMVTRDYLNFYSWRNGAGQPTVITLGYWVDSLVTAFPDPVPLFQGQSTSFSSNTNAFIFSSRHPGRGGTSDNLNWQHVALNQGQYGGSIGSGVDMFHGGFVTPRVGILATGGGSSPQLYGRLRGVARDMRMVQGAISLPALDTLVIDGVTYVNTQNFHQSSSPGILVARDVA